MTIVSLEYLFFILFSLGIYYIWPKKSQWIWLSIVSFFFYIFSTTPFTGIFIIFTAVTTYISTRIMDKQREEGVKNPGILIITFTIILNIIIWLFLKGEMLWKPVLHIFNFHAFDKSHLYLISAMGMGYYTAQIIGYLLDCYWDIRKPEKNFFKVLLFTGFFPQLISGPISTYDEFQTVFEPHTFSYENFTRGAQRILFGFLKKLVIAEKLALMINPIWAEPDKFTGFYTWVAFLLFPLLLYADFSGCLDIVLGTAEMFGIKLPENFRAPFFSKTIQEFWQRWHITLGKWAKNYILYPVLRTKAFSKLRKKTNKQVATFAAMFLLWMVMGLWHGALNHIVGVSIWYWLLLILGNFSAPYLKKAKDYLKYDENSFSFQLFQSLRTYIIFAIGSIFFKAPTITEGFEFIGRMADTFKNPNPWILFGMDIKSMNLRVDDIVVLVIALLIILIVDTIKNSKGSAREWMEKQILPFRWFVWLFVLVLVIIYGEYGLNVNPGTFVYQGF